MLLLSPISVYASDLSEPVPVFNGYEVLGYDSVGNIVLSNDDYEEYFNACLQERLEMIQAGEEVEPYAVQPFSDSPIMTLDALDVLDETKIAEKTRFINLPSWLDTALDFAEYMLKNPTMSAGVGSTYNERISSVGKKRIYYSAVDVYENITVQLNISPSSGEMDALFSRSGFGVSSTFHLYSAEGASVSVVWSASQYTVSCTSPGIYIGMAGYSANSLPVYSTKAISLLAENHELIRGSWTASSTGRSLSLYAENTFMTNSQDYNVKHAFIYASGKYWSPCSVYSPISAGTVINNNNYNEYSQYGYYINEDGDVDLDLDALLAYIENEWLPQLELEYKGTYQHFPDIDADITDEDITYIDPFPPDEEETEPLPPATLPSGSGGGGMTPEELDGVLNQETFYILDMETNYPDVVIGTLPAVQDFSPDVVSVASGVLDFGVQLISSAGLMPIFTTLSVLAFIVFVLRG